MTAAQSAFLAAELERHGCLGPSAPASGDPAARFCELVIGAHAALLLRAGAFYPELAELVADGASLSVAVPKIAGGGDLAAELFRRLAQLCAQTALRSVPVAGWIGAVEQKIGQVRQPLLAATHMARAAYGLELPILEWYTAFMQVGYGSNAVALTGTITENTSSIGVHFAREKAKANTLLAAAGFPIADGGLVHDLAQARKRAAALGYPVVVKPADRDGGLAVSSDIRDEAELTQAFATAQAASPKVMVEKHIDGTDYRMLLYRGELLVTLERTPGGVIGNGRDSVARLVERTNEERKGTPLHELAFNREAEDMLRRHGLAAGSVPAKGRFVQLRRAANHALGGSVRRFDEVHPENVELARRAMRLLRLDLAGLDLILPDATRPWHEAGGVICEVNAQPFVGEPVGRDYYAEILAQLVPNGGRIPLVLAVGAPDAKVLTKLETQMPGLAVIDGDGARRDGRPLSVAGMGWPHACQAALYDQQTAAALCVLDPAQPIPRYSPTDLFSAAIVLEAPEGGVTEPLAALLRRAGKAVYATPEAAPSLKKAKLKATPIQKAELKRTLGALLAGKPIPAAARPKPAPRGTAPPASRKRR